LSNDTTNKAHTHGTQNGFIRPFLHDSVFLNIIRDTNSFFYVVQQPKLGIDRLTVDVSRSHTNRHTQVRYDSYK